MLISLSKLSSQHIILTVNSYSDIEDETQVNVEIAASDIPAGYFLDGFQGSVEWDNRYLTFVSATANQGVGDFTLGTDIHEIAENTFARTFIAGAVDDNVTNGTIMTWTFEYDSEGIGTCAFVRLGNNPLVITLTHNFWDEFTADLIDGEVCGALCDPPQIISDPTGATKCAGESHTFSVTATGDGLSYQWQKDETDITGAPNSNQYTINNISIDDAGDYRCVVTGNCGSEVSGIAILIVNPLPQNPTLSSNSPICSGEDAIFTISGNAGFEVTYSGITGTPTSPVTIGAGGSVDILVSPALSNQTIAITGINDGTCSNMSLNIQETVIVNTSPVAPTAIAGTNATSTSFVANWNASPGALTYYLDVSEASDFSSFVTDYQNNNVGNVTSHLVTGLSPNTSYYYQVRAENLCGISGNSNSIEYQTNESDITVTVNSYYDIPDDNQVNVEIVVSGIPAGEYLDGFNGTLSWDNRYLTFVNATANQGVSDFSMGDINEDYEVNTSGRTFLGSASGLNVTNGTFMTWTFTYNSENTGACGFVRVDDNILATEWTNNNFSTWIANLVDGEVCGFICTPPNISVQPEGAEKCVGENHTFSLTANGDGLTYQWKKNDLDISGAPNSNQFTINSLSISDAGDYTCEITGDCGLLVSDVATLIVNPLPSEPVISTNSPLCYQEDAVFTITGEANLIVHYSGISGDPVSPVNLGAGGESIVTVSSAVSNQTMTITEISNGTCSLNTNLSETISIIPVASIDNINGQSPMCVGQTETFTLTGVNYGGTGIGTWSSSNETYASINQDGDVIAHTEGTTNITYTISGGCGGEVSAVFELTVNLDNTITLSSNPETTDQEVCQNSAIQEIVYSTTGATGASFTNLPAGVTGSWDSHEVTINGTPTVHGIFEYTVSLLGGCGDISISGNITVTETPEINLTNIYCDGLDFYIVEFTSTVGTITSTEGVVGDDIITDIPANTDIVITANNEGCSAELDVDAPNCDCESITVPAPLNPQDQTVCFGFANPDLSVDSPEPQSDYEINWFDLPSGGVAIASNTNTYNPTDTQPGTYSYYAEALDLSTGCTSDRVEVSLTIIGTPIVDELDDITACGSYILPELTNGAYYTEQNGEGTNLTYGTEITESQTIYIFAETGSEPNCVNESNFTITINENPEISGDNIICGIEETIVLNGSGTPHPTNAWISQNPEIITVSDGILTSVDFGTSTIIFMDINECVAEILVTVSEDTNPEFETFGPYCAGDQPEELPLISENGIAGTWNPVQINTEIEGTYTFVFTPETGLCANIYSMEINIFPSDIDASYITEDARCPNGSDGSILFSISGGTPPYILSWNEDNYTNSAYVSGLSSGIYELTITDSLNCHIVIPGIAINDGTEYCIFIPNAFTPNSDGINDKWIIEGIMNYPAYEIKVFNRWGQVIYKSYYGEDDWDGTYKGRILPAGSYIYNIILEKDTDPFVGTVTIVR